MAPGLASSSCAQVSQGSPSTAPQAGGLTAREAYSPTVLQRETLHPGVGWAVDLEGSWAQSLPPGVQWHQVSCGLRPLTSVCIHLAFSALCVSIRASDHGGLPPGPRALACPGPPCGSAAGRPRSPPHPELLHCTLTSLGRPPSLENNTGVGGHLAGPAWEPGFNRLFPWGVGIGGCSPSGCLVHGTTRGLAGVGVMVG